jgi:phage gp36-like protein
MSMFLTQTDYKTLIQDHILSQVINDDVELLDQAELMAISEMESYLSARYDTQAIFAATGTNRHQALVMFALDMTIYHLHSRVSPRNISQLREERYNRAIEWLQNVAKGKLNPGLPILKNEDGEQTSVIKWGSNDKLTHQF